MKAWDIFKKTVPMYLCLSKNSNFIDYKNIYISKSGVNHFSCNFAIIENTNAFEQQLVIKKNFNCDGLIFSTDQNKESIDSWGKSHNLQYLGKFPLMSKKTGILLKNKENKYNIQVKRVLNNDKTFKDFLSVFTAVRKLNMEESVKMFSSKIFNPDYFLYVAYCNNIPAGSSFLIKTENNFMAVDVDVLEEFRQLNIFTFFAEKAFSDAKQNNIENHFALPTSPFVYKFGINVGYTVDGFCHIWKTKMKEAA